MDAEENLDAKKEANDAKTLENLSLNDQVNFSTLTLQIYQDQTVKQEMIANEKVLMPTDQILVCKFGTVSKLDGLY